MIWRAAVSVRDSPSSLASGAGSRARPPGSGYMTSATSRALASAAISTRSVIERLTVIPDIAAMHPDRTSRSTIQVRPLLASCAAVIKASVDVPTPPLAPTNATTDPKPRGMRSSGALVLARTVRDHSRTGWSLLEISSTDSGSASTVRAPASMAAVSVSALRLRARRTMGTSGCARANS